MPKTLVPSYRHHKASGQALVQVKGRRTYLGRYGTQESQERYSRFIAELAAAPTLPPTPDRHDGLMVAEPAVPYWDYAQSYYSTTRSSLDRIRAALKVLREPYGHTEAALEELKQGRSGAREAEPIRPVAISQGRRCAATVGRRRKWVEQ